MEELTSEERDNARRLAYRYPNKLNVLYECPCDVENKERHHPDYSKPFDVHMLCKKCHSRIPVIRKNSNRIKKERTTITMSKKTIAMVSELAAKESRSFSNMFDVLMREGLMRYTGRAKE